MNANELMAACVVVFLICVWVAGPRKFVERLAVVLGYAAGALAVLVAGWTWWLHPAIDAQVADWKGQVASAVPHVEVPHIQLPTVTLPKVGG